MPHRDFKGPGELQVTVNRAKRNAAGQLAASLVILNISHENIALYGNGGAAIMTDTGETSESSDASGLPICTVSCQIPHAAIGVYVDPVIVERDNSMMATFIFPGEAAIPEAVGHNPDGYLTLQDRPIIAAAVNAIKEIATLSDTFKNTLIAWLGSATNGITDLFAKIGHFDQVQSNETDTQKLCTTRSDGTQVCITNDQLAALLSQAGASNLPTSVTSSGTPQASNSVSSGNGNSTTTNAVSTPPVISINGANPATITVGSTYADLGATITGPQADVNLGLTVVVDNATSTDGTVQIDTSKPGTHTILYTVTDPSDLAGSATRTVIVSAPQQTPPPANDNTPPAANDNTASTTATSTAQ
jgi:hypothetical protein